MEVILLNNHPPGGEVIRAEVISRSSSGGSDITITPALITPPSTPEPGINPWD